MQTGAGTHAPTPPRDTIPHMTTPETPPQTNPPEPQEQVNERLARLEEGQRHLIDLVRDLREEFRTSLRELNRRVDDNQQQTNQRFDHSQQESNRRFDHMQHQTNRILYAVIGLGGALVVGLLVNIFTT